MQIERTAHLLNELLFWSIKTDPAKTGPGGSLTNGYAFYIIDMALGSHALHIMTADVEEPFRGVYACVVHMCHHVFIIYLLNSV